MRQLAGTCLVAVALILAPCLAPACDLRLPPLSADIRPMPVVKALIQMAAQTRLQWLSEPAAEEYIRRNRLQVHRVRAGTAPEAALAALLEGTGLGFQCSDTGRGVTIVLLPPPAAATPPPVPELQEEVLVLAGALFSDRGSQPMPVNTTVHDAVRIRESGMKKIDEIALLTPGVDFGPISSVGALPYTIIVIRGVLDRHGNAVGLWFDDIPLPAVASNSFARGYPYTFDLDKVEILAGPQPALLGANAQGGAVEVMPRQPSSSRYSAMTGAEWAMTRGGRSTRELGGAIGGPLVKDLLGVRFTAWYRTEGGYVDRVNPFTRDIVAGDSNRSESRHARIALRLGRDDGSYLTTALTYQATSFADSAAFNIFESPSHPEDTLSDPDTGAFRNGALIAQPFSDRHRILSLKGVLDLGSFKLQNVTSYIRREAQMLSDDTESVRWGGFGNSRYPGELAYPSDMADLITTNVDLQQRAFTQQLQLRFDSGDGRISAGVGGFYSNTRTTETDHVHADALPDNPSKLGLLAGRRFDLVVPTTTVQSEVAAYSWVKYWFNDRFAASVGLRVARQDFSADALDDPQPEPVLPTPLPPPYANLWKFDFHQRGSSSVTAPQYGITYKPGGRAVGRGTEYYFAAGKGYAPGNVDGARPTCLEDPVVYPTDALWSYEAGMRHSWGKSGERAALDLSVFDVRWDNGPVAQRTCLFMHLPGKAESRGLGFSATLPLGGGFRFSVAAAYVDAFYRQTRSRDDGVTIIRDANPLPQDTGPVIVSRGDALGTPPQVIAPWNVTASLEKRFRPLGGWETSIRLEDSFRSRNHGPFYTDNADAMYPANLRSDPANNLLNARLALRHGGMEIGVFANNVLNSSPALLKRNKGNDQNSLFYATTFRPRTLGLSLNWDFGIAP